MPVPSPSLPFASRLLRWAGAAWFVAAIIGQVAFIVFILAFYGTRTATGNFAGWNDKPLIDGYVAGDDLGNLMFIAHVLMAAVVTLGGLMQLWPALRRRLPRLHRWTGRVFLIVALFMALSGAWLTIVRGTWLSEISAVAILGDAVLILVFAVFAWRRALQRRFEAHRVWAMRAFMAVSGVWFLRSGLMAWIILCQGPVGMTKILSGPTDIVLTFGSYLIPLAVLELYLAAGRSPRTAPKIAVAALVCLAALYTAVGVFGTAAFMWGPYL
ncbi:hypothetical protein QE419_000397 [Brevundimonas vesicularis]|uniref:DUF2306 domain-containing protein n=1 Tax=Brevundimonas TaxID=41275 RepID=UPI002782D248|nr:DUF2306 domain-containing protein [Brevundimonas vesicularis]MDQ1191631.1 hypothetical protein [Brevundimonas vesicularis]